VAIAKETAAAAAAAAAMNESGGVEGLLSGRTPGSNAASPRPADTPFGATAAKIQETKGQIHEVMNSLGVDSRKVAGLLTNFQPRGKDEHGAPAQIDHKSFCRLLNLTPNAITQRMFSLFDHDKSGSIDTKEFLVGISAYADSTKDDKIKFAFSLFDEDGSGKISLAELMKIMKATHLASSAKQIQKKAEQILKNGDVDRDGMLSYEEFVNVCKAYPNLLFPVFAITRTVDAAAGVHH